MFSRTLARIEHGAVVSGPVGEFTRDLKARSGGCIWPVGGGELAGAYLAAGAVDALIVYVHPVLIGRGLPLAAGRARDVTLRLTGTQAYASGLVRLAYMVRNAVYRGSCRRASSSAGLCTGAEQLGPRHT